MILEIIEDDLFYEVYDELDKQNLEVIQLKEEYFCEDCEEWGNEYE